jgi:hypothetical protein
LVKVHELNLDFHAANTLHMPTLEASLLLTM